MSATFPPGSQVATIYHALKVAALAGKPAPSNTALARMIGARSTSTAIDRMRQLVNGGHIIVEAGNDHRVVSCAQGEWRTAGTVKRRRPKKIPRDRVWTEADMEAMRAIARGEGTIGDYARKSGIPRSTLGRKIEDLGLRRQCKPRPAPVFAAPEPPPEPPKRGDGWIPIAHGNNGKWREYEGAPISIVAARMAVSAGRATMAQRRIDGAFDLLFRVVRA